MAGEQLIVADDDLAIRTVLARAFESQGYRVATANSVASLLALAERQPADLILTDVYMPDESVLEVLPHLRAAQPGVPLIVMSAQSTLRTAVEATAQGAYDYVAKPFDLDDLLALVARALAGRSAAPAVPNEHLIGADDLPLIGRSPAMQEIYRAMARLMPTDLTVLIAGESGTGKELIARALHDMGRRNGKSFIAVNMAAIPRELIEAELFGYEKGAFTGATDRGIGKFEQAAGGTLFLDEIGDMPFEAQTRLLRVLQDGELTRVGGRTAVKADVRIIAATHRDLKQLISAGDFREDLYYRLNVVPLRVPPLRDRLDDIPELARHFLSQAQAEGLPLKALEPAAMAALKAHRWPGNVRELENVMRRLAALTAEDVITRAAMEAELAEAEQEEDATAIAAGRSSETMSESIERHLRRYFERHGKDLPASGLYNRIVREVERPLIELTLEATRGNQIKAAELLGINRNTLRKKIRELDIEVVRGATRR